jgi:cyclopropane-fatty-acyl-phospholipid synthase
MKLLFRTIETADGLVVRPVGSYGSYRIIERSRGSFLRAAATGSAELLASYAKGEWDADDLYGLLSALWCTEQALRKLRLGMWPLDWLRATAGRLNSRRATRHRETDYSKAAAHYDLPIELFKEFLGHNLAYSAAAIRVNAIDEDSAYDEYYRDILQKLVGDRPQQVILDLGCGWGAFARYVMTKTSHSVHAITISSSQADYIKRELSAYIPARLTVVVGDFTRAQNMPATVDAAVLLESIEHIRRNDRLDLFGRLRTLYPDARIMIQFSAIPSWTESQKSGKATAGNSLIFPGPNEVVPTRRAIVRQARRAGYRVLFSEDLTAEYATITFGWRARFRAGAGELASIMPSELIRAWDFYLTGLTAAFGRRTLFNYQVIICRDDASTIQAPR